MMKAALLLLCAASTALAQRPRARDLGIPFDGTPGPLNAITDVAGIEVGHTTLIQGQGRLERGRGPVRTGVTAILPRGRATFDPVFAHWFSLNGNGEMTGTTWIEESGFLEGPVLITNTHSVGVARDAAISWLLQRNAQFFWALPVVAETFDGMLNDINGFHVRPEHVHAALDAARGGAVAEGSVGGGTGMVCNSFKGGIGTSSRAVTVQGSRYTVGVLVQCNYGSRQELRIVGVPVGREIRSVPPPCYDAPSPPSQPILRFLARCATGGSSSREPSMPELGSIIIVVATDAPLLPHQLRRLTKRAALGLGREGSIASNGSGDIFVAFSTANAGAASDSAVARLQMLPNEHMDRLFLATVQATEEAITNAMLAAETMTGADGVRVSGLPGQEVVEILRRYGRIP